MLSLASVLAETNPTRRNHIVHYLFLFTLSMSSSQERPKNHTSSLHPAVMGCESNTIAIRLANEIGSDLWPTGRDQPHAQQWLSWDSEHFKPVVATYFVENVLKPFVGETPDRVALARADADFPKLATILNDALQGREFILGPRPTVADFALATFLPFADASQLNFEATAGSITAPGGSSAACGAV